MRKSLKKSTRLLCLVALLSWFPVTAKADTFFDGIVTFGTSLSDSGNAFSLTKQQSVPRDYSLDELLIPDSAYAQGGHHLSNGSTWVEQLATPLSMAANVQPATRDRNPNAANYAVGGTRAGFPVLGRILLTDQVQAFLDDFDTAPSNFLYVIEMGSNDVRDAIGAFLVTLQTGGTPTEAEAAADLFITAALDGIETNVSELIAKGAGNFLYLTVPPLETTPAIRALNQSLALIFDPIFGPNFVIMIANNLVTDFNVRLNTRLENLTVSGEIIKLDINSLAQDMIDNPEIFKLTNVDSACLTPLIAPFKCKNPDEYFFWDGIHPTKVVHGIIAEQAAFELGIN